MRLVLRMQDVFFFSSRRRHTRFDCDWSSDVCSSDLSIAIVNDCDGHERGDGAVPAGRGTRDRRGGPVSVGAGGAGDRSGEVGRGSCRGRGEISVGAGSLKKKKAKVVMTTQRRGYSRK